jgi:hypothetical protein
MSKTVVLPGATFEVEAPIVLSGWVPVSMLFGWLE